jgi:hypothetical protein
MPNLLGVLAVRPALCVQVVPADAHHRANAFAAALGPVLPGTGFESVEVAVPRGRGTPSGTEVSRCVSAEIAGLREAGYEPVVNVTGDGSPVSLGALAGALACKARTLYVDTAAGAPLLADPVGGAGGELPADWTDASRVRDALTTRLVAAVHGVELVAGPRDPEALLDVALRMAALGPKEWAELRDALPDVGTLRLPEKFLEMAVKPVRLPAFAREIEDAALAAGLLTKSDLGMLHFSLPEVEREALWRLASERAAFVKFTGEEWNARLAEGTGSLGFARDFLGAGGWFDILVWDHLRNSDRFRDVLWNPCVATPHGPEVEAGVFAVEGFNLAAFSCQPGGAVAGLPAVAATLAKRARRLGGAGANKYLALALQPQNLNEVIAQSGAYGVKVIGDSRAFRAGSARDPFAGFKVTA